MLSLAVVIIALIISFANGQSCNVNNGPGGTMECVLLTPYYNTYQWATCLTTAYIRQKTKFKADCTVRTAKYCWNQCMFEIYELDRGLVTNPCTCSPSQKLNNTLPEICYSPDGTSCSWYRDCLQTRYNCSSSPAEYAIKYAEKYCNLYNENFNFTNDGKNWTNAVRKCLQVALVPIIRPWTIYNCQEIRDYAIASHIPCYLNPDNSGISVCKLPITDWLRVVWTIKKAFITTGFIFESINALMNISLACLKSFSYEEARSFPFNSYSLEFSSNKARANVQPIDYNELAALIGYKISSTMNLDSNVFDWIVFMNNSAVNKGNIVACIWLLSRNEVDSGISAKDSTVLKSVDSYFKEAFLNGKLQLTVSIGTTTLTSKTLSTCSDPKCTETSTVTPVTVGLNPITSKANKVNLLLLVMVLLLVNIVQI